MKPVMNTGAEKTRRSLPQRMTTYPPLAPLLVEMETNDDPQSPAIVLRRVGRARRSRSTVEHRATAVGAGRAAHSRDRQPGSAQRGWHRQERKLHYRSEAGRFRNYRGRDFGEVGELC